MKNIRKKPLSIQKFFDEDGNKKETSIEAKVRKWLISQGIPFQQEKYIKHNGQWKCYDFYITDGINFFLLVEVDGKYFHSQDYKDGKQKRSKLTRLQKHNLYNDKKKEKIAESLGIPLIRLTEKSIRYGFENITAEILDVINKQKETLGT